MKFFFNNNISIKKQTKTHINIYKLYTPVQVSDLLNFTSFFFKNGKHLSFKKNICKIFSKINLFLYKNNNYIIQNYNNVSWVLENFFFKKLNFQNVFTPLMHLIKSPFSVKSVLVSKKIKKKTKIKYVMKITYKGSSKRIRGSLKQLYYHSNKFIDNNFNVRLYKAITSSFFDWKQSQLFKLKTLVFKKYFKF